MNNDGGIRESEREGGGFRERERVSMGK